MNNTADLTYYACDITPKSLVPGLNDPQAGCLSLQGGIVDCLDGACTMSWRNGEFSYLVVGPIAEFGEPGSTALQVRESGRVILDSPDLMVIDSSL